MIVMIDYASPSVFDVEIDSAVVGIAGDARRPVCFEATVRRRHAFLLRVALRTLGELIWSDDTWLAQSDILDPVITVHPDRLFFEAFSQDQSAYGCLICEPEVFEPEGEVVHGTTNIDFTAWLWGALGELRSSRETTLRIGARGMGVKTAGAGGRFEKKVDLPDDWVRGFLQTQAAMAMPGTRITVQPVDLLSAIRYIRYTRAKVSPRALRFELEPGEDARLVLEPWEHVVPLVGAQHNYSEPKTTRVWGRRRLELIEGLLPFADRVDIYLKGRALPSFYAVKLPGMTFVLGMTGWSGSQFTSSGGFDLLAEAARADDAQLEPALELLRARHHLSVAELAAQLDTGEQQAAGLLVRLCRRGQAMFDVEARDYRHRELFRKPIDEDELFPPDRRRELSEEMLAAGQVEISSCEVEETTKVRRFKNPQSSEPIVRKVVYRDWRVRGRAGGAEPVEIVVGDRGSIIFGRCTCAFFEEHLLNQGPCEHMLALFAASRERRVDAATSEAADSSQLETARTRPSRWEVDDGDEEIDEGDDDFEEDV